jgi:hypothetical protein
LLKEANHCISSVYVITHTKNNKIIILHIVVVGILNFTYKERNKMERDNRWNGKKFTQNELMLKNDDR